VLNSLGSTVRDVATVHALPWHPGYSPARNQSRQRLAALSHANLSFLVVDCLAEVKHRWDLARSALNGNPPPVVVDPTAAGYFSGVSRVEAPVAAVQKAQFSSLTPLTGGEDADYDEPLYDSVASEDDYAVVDKEKKLSSLQINRLGASSVRKVLG
jgi:hypothetical protein